MAWQIDSAHTRIGFSVRHMMISNVHGEFKTVNGTVEFNEQEPTLSTVDVEIEADSIDTHEARRDAHLRSADFLNTEEYPLLTFKSTRVEKVDDSHGRIHGDLTIRGVTRPVVLDTEYAGQVKSPWGTFSAGFTARTKINRKEWGLVWNVGLETGGVLVGDEVTITIETEIVKQEATEPEVATA